MLTTQDIQSKVDSKQKAQKDVEIDRMLLLFFILLLSALCLTGAVWLASKLFF